MEDKMICTDIDINTFKGSIDGDLVIYEKGGDPEEGLVLYGFDEVGLFDNEFKAPQYCFLKGAEDDGIENVDDVVQELEEALASSEDGFI
tara:strand:- start:300 stop:569 length:270 start_codon:yes stop_codon:yes gene_type:complete